jgi:hypothetical protein
MLRSARRVLACLSLAILVALSSPAAAQERTQQVLVERGVSSTQTLVPAGLGQEADQLRDSFRELMRQYPPALARVLRLDASLMTNDAYLGTYPALGAFLKAHPEISRYPDYFLDFAGNGWGNWEPPLDAQSQLRREALNAQRNMFEMLTIIAAVSGVVFGLVWLVRMFVTHRRWLRSTRLQSELNNRLLERMGSNEQLLAYLQSQAGQQLMAPPVVNDYAASAAAPISRILWAVQASLVLICAGIGFIVLRNYVFVETGEAPLTFGVLAIAIGTGFAGASYASYVLSKRFGLLETPRAGDDAGRL